MPGRAQVARAPAHGAQQPSQSHGSATAADGGGASRCVCAHAFLGWQGVGVRGGARQTNTKCLLQPRRGPRRCMISCRQGHGGLKRKVGEQSQVLGVCARRRAVAVVRCTEVKAARGGQTYGCGPVARGENQAQNGCGAAPVAAVFGLAYAGSGRQCDCASGHGLRISVRSHPPG